MRLLLSIGLALITMMLTGCTADKSAVKGDGSTREAKLSSTLKVEVSGFKAGERIPDRYTCYGDDIAPAVSWQGVPEETKSLALIVSDPDAPGGTFYHLVLYDIPVNVKGLSESFTIKQLREMGIKVGKNDFGNLGYNGPCPPPGKPHRYYFRVYALDVTTLKLPEGATGRDVLRAMNEHILAIGEYMGTFSAR